MMVIDEDMIIATIRDQFEQMVIEADSRANLNIDRTNTTPWNYIDPEVNNEWGWFYSGYVVSLKNRYNKNKLV